MRRKKKGTTEIAERHRKEKKRKEKGKAKEIKKIGKNNINGGMYSIFLKEERTREREESVAGRERREKEREEVLTKESESEEGGKTDGEVLLPEVSAGCPVWRTVRYGTVRYSTVRYSTRYFCSLPVVVYVYSGQ